MLTVPCPPRLAPPRPALPHPTSSTHDVLLSLLYGWSLLLAKRVIEFHWYTCALWQLGGAPIAPLVFCCEHFLWRCSSAGEGDPKSHSHFYARLLELPILSLSLLIGLGLSIFYAIALQKTTQNGECMPMVVE